MTSVENLAKAAELMIKLCDMQIKGHEDETKKAEIQAECWRLLRQEAN